MVTNHTASCRALHCEEAHSSNYPSLQDYRGCFYAPAAVVGGHQGWEVVQTVQESGARKRPAGAAIENMKIVFGFEKYRHFEDQRHIRCPRLCYMPRIYGH